MKYNAFDTPDNRRKFGNHAVNMTYGSGAKGLSAAIHLYDKIINGFTNEELEDMYENHDCDMDTHGYCNGCNKLYELENER